MLGEYVVYRLPNGDVLVDWNENTWKYGYPAYPKHMCKELERGVTEGGPALAKFAAQMRKKYETICPAHQFDAVEREYILNKGWRINADGLLEITAKQAREEPYISRDLSDPSKHTLMVAGAHGCTLLFEGKHFIVV